MHEQKQTTWISLYFCVTSFPKLGYTICWNKDKTIWTLWAFQMLQIKIYSRSVFSHVHTPFICQNSVVYGYLPLLFFCNMELMVFQLITSDTNSSAYIPLHQCCGCNDNISSRAARLNSWITSFPRAPSHSQRLWVSWVWERIGVVLGAIGWCIKEREEQGSVATELIITYVPAWPHNTPFGLSTEPVTICPSSRKCPLF